MRRAIIALPFLFLCCQIYLAQAYFYPHQYAMWRVDRAYDANHQTRGRGCVMDQQYPYGRSFERHPIWKIEDVFGNGNTRRGVWRYLTQRCAKSEAAWILASGKIIFGDPEDLVVPKSSLDVFSFEESDKDEGDR